MPSTRSKATRSRGVRRICLSEKTSACEQARVPLLRGAALDFASLHLALAQSRYVNITKLVCLQASLRQPIWSYSRTARCSQKFGFLSNKKNEHYPRFLYDNTHLIFIPIILFLVSQIKRRLSALACLLACLLAC